MIIADIAEIIKQCYRDKTGQGSRHLSRFLMSILTLLAESKTMAPNQKSVSETDFESHKPCFEDTADSIMAFFASLQPSQIAERLKISGQLAVKAHNLAYDFPHKLTGYQALYAFTGEAYRALDVTSLSDNIIERADPVLRIISSVYGCLKPSDIVKPYRCEFAKPITADNKTAIQIFKAKNTVQLVNFVKENDITDIIDLLPGDADKSIDWKILRAFTKVQKVCFQIITPDGKLKTPIAKRLKELRGIMARTILEKNIQSFQELTETESSHFIFSPHDSKPLLPVFISTE